MGNHRPGFRILAIELHPFVHIRFGIGADCVGRALRFTHTAVDAFIRMDDQHVFTFIEAVHRTDFHTVGVFTGDAVVGDDIGHERLPGLSVPAAN